MFFFENKIYLLDAVYSGYYASARSVTVVDLTIVDFIVALQIEKIKKKKELSEDDDYNLSQLEIYKDDILKGDYNEVLKNTYYFGEIEGKHSECVGGIELSKLNHFIDGFDLFKKEDNFDTYDLLEYVFTDEFLELFDFEKDITINDLNTFVDIYNNEFPNLEINIEKETSSYSCLNTILQNIDNYYSTIKMNTVTVMDESVINEIMKLDKFKNAENIVVNVSYSEK